MYTIAVIAFGESSTRKICRILALLEVRYIIVLPHETPTFKPTHIILSGGPDHVYDPIHGRLPQWVLDATCPVLAICYGMQLIAHTFGGTVRPMPEKELGLVPVTELIQGTQQTRLRWMNRHDRVLTVPTGFTITGVTDRNHIASFTDFHKYYAIQYHPEHKTGLDRSVFERFLSTTYH
jgi:GMP synthase (glutamine-hydrolysing)